MAFLKKGGRRIPFKYRRFRKNLSVEDDENAAGCVRGGVPTTVL